MAFLRATFWEFVQNQAALLVLASAVWLWPRNRGWAVVLSLVGGAAAALVLHAVEPFKTAAARSSWGGTLLNAAIFGVAIAGMSAYLHARWGDWRSDLAVGAALGLLLGLAQATTTDAAIIVKLWHTVALALAGAAVLTVLRLVLVALANSQLAPTLAGSLLVGVVMTAIIAAIDYSYLL